MPKVIYKYQLRETDRQQLHMPKGSIPLSVQVQNDIPTMWVLQTVDAPANTTWTVHCIGTGNRIDEHVPPEFIGTTQMTRGLVWHWFVERE